MDWLKLFALLVAVATVQITADAPKKKIRIHLPQKVKHIHHHKKIYITNHPASSQYAPAFMPSAEGAVAMPTNVAVPAVANMLPELYDESPTRLPGITSAASKLLPLYRARGYYGPTPQEWDDQEYDLAPPPEPTDSTYLPTGFAGPSAAPAVQPNYPPKRVKIVKVNENPRKKAPRKVKPKRVLVRGKPGQAEEEHPVSTFHEQFYSDLDSSGTIRKVRKPQRVEKIIDGDTEHIHTYSEEHIHKLVFDDGSKLGVVGIDPVGSMSALAGAHPLVPLKNSHAILALPSDPLTGYTAVGSMGTPSHLEYTSYNPREVTHDHIFHDHGEIPSDVDITKDPLAYPPRMTYNSQGLRIGLGPHKGLKSKYSHKYLRSQQKPGHLTDFTYYENIYTPYNKLRNVQKPTIPTPYESPEQNLEDYRPIPHFKVKDKANFKTRNVVPALYFGNGKQVSDYRLQQASASAPYSVSSTVVHDYKPKHYPGQGVEAVSLSKFNKNIYNYPNTYEYDSFASSSNLFGSENTGLNYPTKKGKKKSISTQNISFGGLDHQTTVDHLEDSGVSATSLNNVPSAFENFNSYDQPKALESAPSTAYTIRETSPVHPYYTSMAVKALNGEQVSLAEASNDNYQYAEAPVPSTTPFIATVATTTAPPQEYYEIQSTDTISTEAPTYDTRPRTAPKDKSSEVSSLHKEPKPRYKIIALQSKEMLSTHESDHYYKHSADASSTSGKLKYGDKI
ncbi:uncharacterized protein LOC113494071 isoform X1 [Trichoplusia ni]|uniref:Uncharacterized protein LOC113494071 isoform X1 n=1 Tax=Trichoplusia ni TaxID=7111 RepID=A0A7E5VI58_TRINI|nr:uncharacterized protein LOC113494071 isoform X1 [Trichoplusia ni]